MGSALCSTPSQKHDLLLIYFNPPHSLRRVSDRYQEIDSEWTLGLLLFPLSPLAAQAPVAGSDPIPPVLACRTCTWPMPRSCLLASGTLHFNSQASESQITYITSCSKEPLIKLAFIDPLGEKIKENNKCWWLIFLRKSHQVLCSTCSERKISHYWIHGKDNAYSFLVGNLCPKVSPFSV